jgi:hypothetical protein
VSSQDSSKSLFVAAGTLIPERPPVSQEHGSKKVNDIDAGQVKDNDRVICEGHTADGVLHATLISKRLSR